MYEKNETEQEPKFMFGLNIKLKTKVLQKGKELYRIKWEYLFGLNE